MEELIVLMEAEIVARLDAADGEIGAASYLLPQTFRAGEIVRRGKYLAEARRILRALRIDLVGEVTRGQKE